MTKSKTSKARRHLAAQSWYGKLSLTAHGRYSIQSLLNDNVSPALELGGMTEKQLRVVLALVASAYNAGCSDTREHFASMRVQDSVLKAVQS